MTSQKRYKDKTCHTEFPFLSHADFQIVPTKQKQQKKKNEFEYFYTIDATNFHSLSKEKQEQKLGNFFDLLRSLEKQIRITFARKTVPLLIAGKPEERHILQVLVASNEPLTGILDSLLYEYTVDIEHPRIKFTKEKLGYLEYPEGHVRCLSLYDVPAQLRWAWVHEVFATCGQIDVWIDPVEKEKALTTMRRKRSMLMNRVEKNKQAAEEFRQVEGTMERLHKDMDKLYKFGMVAMVYGKTLKDLRANTRAFKKNLRVIGGKFDATISRQGMMYHGKWIHYIMVAQSFMSVVYPFVSAEMIETPNGIVLGYNMDSGGPAIYDIMRRANGNVIIIGSTGYGKSYAAKIVVKRLIQRLFDEDETQEGPAVFIIDPNNEYYHHRDYYGLDGMIITSDKELGIDPFKILKPTDAAGILASVTEADEKNKAVANEFYKHADRVHSVHEMYSVVSTEAKKYLEHLVDGPLANIMKGESKITDHTIISLDNASGKPHEILILLLVLNKIWNRVVDLSPNRRRIIVVDEGWLLGKMRGAMSYVDQIVRTGRKLGVYFIFISQRVDDISKDHGEGKMIDNIGTKILMKLEANAAKDAQGLMELTDEETERLTRFSKGQGLVITEKHRVKIKFEATEEEAEHFDTRPR